MSETAQNDPVNFGVDPELIRTDALSKEYEELSERWASHTITEDGRERRMRVWNELRDRADVEQPQCPECGARNWGFTDHTECLECGYGLHMGDDELLQEIQSAWDAIRTGGTA